MDKQNKTTPEMKETVKASKYFDVCIKNDAGEVLFSGQIDVILGAFHYKDGSGTETLNASVGPIKSVIETTVCAEELVEQQQDRIVDKFINEVICKKAPCDGEEGKDETNEENNAGEKKCNNCPVDFQKFVKDFFGIKD